MGLWPAVSRAMDAVPPRDLRDVPSSVVLQCFSHDCEGCNAFAPRRAEYESRTFRGRDVIPWNCDVSDKKNFAVGVGATKLPCYIDAQSGTVTYPS
jgi:hypothetical protein